MPSNVSRIQLLGGRMCLRAFKLCACNTDIRHTALLDAAIGIHCNTLNQCQLQQRAHASDRNANAQVPPGGVHNLNTQ